MLWLNVLLQAVDEAEGRQLHGVSSQDKKGVVYRARKWLSCFSTSLYHVGALAGLDKMEIDYLIESNRAKYRDNKGRVI